MTEKPICSLSANITVNVVVFLTDDILGNTSILRNHQFRRIGSTHHLIFTFHQGNHFQQKFEPPTHVQ